MQLKFSFTYYVLIAISFYLFSCNKQSVQDNQTNVLADSTLIQMFAELKTGNPAGYGDLADTQHVERFYYDNLKRIVATERYDSLVYTLPWVYDTYFYNGTDRVPYKIIRNEKNSSNSLYANDTTYFTYGPNGKVLIDSMNSYLSGYGAYNSVIYFTRGTNTLTLSTGDEYKFISNNDNLMYQSDTSANPPLIYTFLYDNHPNPLYRPEFCNMPIDYFYVYGAIAGAIDIKRIQKNNCTSYSRQYIYPPAPVVETYNYTYRNDGYPLKALVTDNYSTLTKQLLYVYLH